MNLERDIVDDLKRILERYQILTPNNFAERGWPDKLIQLPNSRVVACELKRVFVNKGNYYTLGELRQEQCAWLAKWQFHGGLGFVFVGMISNDKLLGYHCIAMNKWDSWLTANKQKYYAVDILADEDVLRWFIDYARGV